MFKLLEMFELGHKLLHCYLPSLPAILPIGFRIPARVSLEDVLLDRDYLVRGHVEREIDFALGSRSN